MAETKSGARARAPYAAERDGAAVSPRADRLQCKPRRNGATACLLAAPIATGTNFICIRRRENVHANNNAASHIRVFHQRRRRRGGMTLLERNYILVYFGAFLRGKRGIPRSLFREKTLYAHSALRK